MWVIVYRRRPLFRLIGVSSPFLQRFSRCKRDEEGASAAGETSETAITVTSFAELDEKVFDHVQEVSDLF